MPRRRLHCRRRYRRGEGHQSLNWTSLERVSKLPRVFPPELLGSNPRYWTDYASLVTVLCHQPIEDSRSCLVGLSIFLQSIDSLLLQNFQSNTWQVKKGAVGEKCGENNLAAKSNKLPGFEPETLRSSFDVVVDFLGGKTQGCVAQTKKWQTNVEWKMKIQTGNIFFPENWITTQHGSSRPGWSSPSSSQRTFSSREISLALLRTDSTNSV